MKKLDELASAIMPGGQFKNEEQVKNQKINTMKNLEELWGKIGSVTKDEVITAVLKDEILLYESRIQPTGTGYLYDAINQRRKI